MVFDACVVSVLLQSRFNMFSLKYITATARVNNILYVLCHNYVLCSGQFRAHMQEGTLQELVSIEIFETSCDEDFTYLS